MIQLLHRANELSRWHRLRGVGNSSVVRLSVLMPVIGYLVLLSDQAVKYLRLDERFSLWAGGTSIRLLLLYYGTFLVAAASLLYAWRCPHAIKKYSTSTDYTEGELEVRIAEQPMFDKMDHGGIVYGEQEKAIVSVAVRRLLLSEWTAMDQAKPNSRLTCWVIYWAGFLTLAVPTLWTFAEITISEFRKVLH